MLAVWYTRTGDPDVLRMVDRPMPLPGPGEVRVRIVRSGVNPTDWKFRRGDVAGADLPAPQVPGMDGAGMVDAVGDGVTAFRPGDRVWVWLAADRRSEGTMQQYVCLPIALVAGLPNTASFDLGASLGIPFITAHRCLTTASGGPDRLGPGALSGRTVLVAGGAGAVGNAAIQLAAWSDARVIATVSSPEKAELAFSAGAHEVIDYKREATRERVTTLAPNGVDIVVEVAPSANGHLDSAVLAHNGTVAMYARDGDGQLSIPIWSGMQSNAHWQFLLIYTFPELAIRQAAEAIGQALKDEAIGVGRGSGLPLTHFELSEAAKAHEAVENGAVGKVLVDVSEIGDASVSC